MVQGGSVIRRAVEIAADLVLLLAMLACGWVTVAVLFAFGAPQ